MVTGLQVSVAVAMPVTFVLVSAGHCRTLSGGNVRTGLVMSCTVMVCTQLLLLPHSSVAVQVRKITFVPVHLFVTESVYRIVTWPQTSWAVATPVTFVPVFAGQSRTLSGGH